jgi:perosamine synthetase
VHRKIIWWQPQLGSSENARVRDVLDSNYLNEGSVTQEFENELAKLLKVNHIVTTTSGTTALFLALKAMGIGPGDEVLVPDLTFIATANAVTMSGATPILVDIDPKTLNICLQSARSALTARTRAIMPVHVSGRAADMSAICKIAQENNLSVIEDAAEALLSMHEGKLLGTIGNMGCFSLSPNKTITTGQGGFIATNDSSLNMKLRQLKDQGRPARGTGGDDIHPALGFNFKFTNLQAAVGLGQLELLDQRVKHLRGTYVQYQKRLANVPGITILPFKTDAGETPQWVDAVAENRDQLCSFLDGKNIGYRKFWHPLHTQTPYRLPDSDFPNSTKSSAAALWLPSCFDVQEADIEYVCETIAAFMQRTVGATH